MKTYNIPRILNVKGAEYESKENKYLVEWEEMYNKITDSGFCFVKIESGDYAGSIAKLTLDENFKELYPFAVRTYSRTYSFNIRGCLYGRLSFKGKRNNPKFTLINEDILLDAEWCDTKLVRFDLKKEGEKLLKNKVFDVDGNEIKKESKVMYLNLRYGSAGKLCHGVVKGFKAHSRGGYVSVLIENENSKEEISECRNPTDQIYVKESK